MSAARIRVSGMPRVVVAARQQLQRDEPTLWSRSVDWRWLDAAVTGDGTDGAGLEPDLWVSVNAPAGGAAGSAGALSIRTGLAREAGQTAAEPFIGSVASWLPPDGSPTIIVEHARAPIYAGDTDQDVADRAEELTIHVIRRAVASVIEGGEESAAGSLAAAPNFEPLTAAEERAWRRRQRARRAWSRLRPREFAKNLVYSGLLAGYRPLRDLLRRRGRRHAVRVFTFHRVTNLTRDSMTVSPRVFREQLLYIRRTHRIVSVEEAVRLAADGARLERPVAAITFDDAYRSVHDFAAPILADLGLTGCCFAPTAFVSTHERFPWDLDSPVLPYLDVMGWPELRELRHRGWTIGGHSATHARLSACDDDSLRRELEGPFELLRHEFRLKHVPMAYPFGGPGDMNDSGIAVARQVGYSACFSNHGGENRGPAQPLRLGRIDIGGDMSAAAWKARVHAVDPVGLRRSRR